MSLWFYAFFNIKYFPIIVFSVGFNYFIGKIIAKAVSRLASRWLMIAALLVNIGVLFYFKYYGFFVENFNSLFKTSFSLLNIVLPLGGYSGRKRTAIASHPDN